MSSEGHHSRPRPIHVDIHHIRHIAALDFNDSGGSKSCICVPILVSFVVGRSISAAEQQSQEV